VVSHKYASERAQKLRRHARTRGAKEIKRDGAVQEIKTRGRALNPEKLSPSLVISTFRRFARTPPVAEKTGQQLTDYRVIEKKGG